MYRMRTFVLRGVNTLLALLLVAAGGMQILNPASTGRTSATSPTDSINPVNITFHEHVRAERRHAAIDERGD